MVGRRLIGRCLVRVGCIAIRGPAGGVHGSSDDGWKAVKRGSTQQHTLALPSTHTHTRTLPTQSSPSDLPAGGEVEEDGALHDVELALSSAADAGQGIIRTLKLNKSLAEARHHGYIARGRRERQLYGLQRRTPLVGVSMHTNTQPGTGVHATQHHCTLTYHQPSQCQPNLAGLYLIALT